MGSSLGIARDRELLGVCGAPLSDGGSDHSIPLDPMDHALYDGV